MKYQKGFAPILIIIMVVVVMGSAGGYVAYKKSQTPKSHQKETINTSIVDTEVEGEVNVSTQEESGTYESDWAEVNLSGPVTSAVNCGTPECFSPQFSSCTPNATIESGIEGLGTYRAQIIGPKAGGCEVTMKYTENPNSEWVNKDLICTLNNKLDYNAAFQEAYEGIFDGSLVCKGPLYLILISL